MRRKLFFLLIANCLWLTGISQYWQQEVNYTIDVSLNDKDHTLDGFERLEYINHSPDTLLFIWIHLWPNAYKNDKTAFSDQLLLNGNTRFYFSDQEERGYINRLDFKVNNITATTEDHPQHIDIIKVILPAPLAPGERTIITTPFHVKLPYNLSRGGHDGESYQATQWYPKPAVYDSKGWHPMPYLNQGEFYSEFGSYDVSITLPQNYAVAATGELQNDEEKQWLKNRAEFLWIPTKTKIKTKGGSVKTVEEEFPRSSSLKKTLRYKQERVHDFAWFADKRFVVKQDTCKLPSGRVVAISVFYSKYKKDWDLFSTGYAKEAVRYFSNAVGEYPYNTLTVVQGPKSFGGGMEYPTITVIAPTGSSTDLQLTTNHEIGHNWFYGILASNERDNPWMDEGMTSYYTSRYREQHGLGYGRLERAAFETMATEHLDQPIQTTSEKFSEQNYFLSSYYKAQEWLRYLESQLGSEVFNAGMKKYFEQWKFKHPQPEDFQRVMEEVSGKDLDVQFAYLNKTGVLPYDRKRGTRFTTSFQPGFGLMNWNDKIPEQKHTIFFSPAVGINGYDKLMIGGMLTNLQLPPSRLQFLVAPMYGTGSKKLTGLGFVNYSFYPGGMIRKIDLGVSGSTFSDNEFTKDDGKKAYFGFQKVAPGIRFTLREKDPRSTLIRYIQFKSYFFNEEAYRVRYDSIFNPPIDTTLKQVITTLNEHRTLNQLKIVVENYRALYPYKGELKIEHGDDFVRAAFTGKYFFNYAREGGLDVRFFAGKFFYTSSRTIIKQFATDRYHLNLTGANGYEDYTYSDYFLGRNKFEGLASQQIMVRDGAFKVRTDLLGDKVGKTDDWLIAANFSSSVPSDINPLSLLPIKIPLKVFVDIGTYAEAWERDANTDRFLFDAGLQIPLIKETINIYVPLIYSRVFKDYKQSYLPKKGRFWKMVSFSIDISNFSLHKFNRHLVF